MARIVNGDIPSYILDEQILLCYQIGSPWYTDKVLVHELMVLRLVAGSTTLADVAMLLDDIADEANAVGTITGGALSKRPRVLARRYSQLGFSEEDSPTLVKWRSRWVES